MKYVRLTGSGWSYDIRNKYYEVTKMERLVSGDIKVSFIIDKEVVVGYLDNNDIHGVELTDLPEPPSESQDTELDALAEKIFIAFGADYQSYAQDAYARAQQFLDYKRERKK